ncbi:hypothetical protein DSECCO2_456180 [anaerobic digester metagenome]
MPASFPPPSSVPYSASIHRGPGPSELLITEVPRPSVRIAGRGIIELNRERCRPGGDVRFKVRNRWRSHYRDVVGHGSGVAPDFVGCGQVDGVGSRRSVYVDRISFL